MAKQSVPTETPNVEAVEVLDLSKCNEPFDFAPWERCGLPTDLALRLSWVAEAGQGMRALCDILRTDYCHADDAETNAQAVSYKPLSVGTIYGLHCAQLALLRRVADEMEFIRDRGGKWFPQHNSAATNGGAA